MIQKTDTKKETPKHILKANIIISRLFGHKFSIEFVSWIKRVCNENTIGIFLKYKERISLLSTTFVKYAQTTENSFNNDVYSVIN